MAEATQETNPVMQDDREEAAAYFMKWHEPMGDMAEAALAGEFDNDPDSLVQAFARRSSKEFNRGIMIAASTILNVWGNTTEADELLAMIGATPKMVKEMGFESYDRDAILARLRLTAQSGEGRAAIIEECAAVADGWNPGRKDRVTETGIATAIRELSGDTREGISAPTQRMAETLGARFAMSGEGRSGAGEDAMREAAENARETLGYIFETSDDHHCAMKAEEAWRKLDAALNARQSGEGERV